MVNYPPPLIDNEVTRAIELLFSALFALHRKEKKEILLDFWGRTYRILVDNQIVINPIPKGDQHE